MIFFSAVSGGFTKQAARETGLGVAVHCCWSLVLGMQLQCYAENIMPFENQGHNDILSSIFSFEKIFLLTN